MDTFLDLGAIQDDLVDHVAKWLRGRPRWTATFLETFFVRKIKSKQERPLGKFEDRELILIHALNRYIEGITEPDIDFVSNRRQSLTFGRASAYTAIEQLFSKKGKNVFDVTEVLRKAIFEFALSGKRSVIRTYVAELIEYGIASVDSTGESPSSSTHFTAKIDELLIIHASITYFGLSETVTGNFVAASSNPSHVGHLFEQFILPGIQKNFNKMVRTRVVSEAAFPTNIKHVAVPKLSSYGVLAVQAKSVGDTIKWISHSLDARFEGTMTPFCYPDTLIGPDVLFFMRTPKYDNFLFVASQAKCKKKADQLEALRTVKPSLFYYQDRKSGGKLNAQLTTQELSDWAVVKKKLFGMVADEDALRSKRRASGSSVQEPATKRTRAMIRLVVQYASVTSNGAPGPVAFTSVKAECSPNCKCEEHDLLVTIDGTSASELLGEEGMAILNLVKNNND
jgi:hypothetical protein